MEFTAEVIENLGYYVYRLIDPRNGHTFYVGKGRGNRIFQHAKGAIGSFEGVADSQDNDPNKLKIIRQILDAGLDIIYVIHRWGLSNDEALLAEAVLIDSYPGLSNVQNGHSSNDYGVTNVKSLIDRFSYKVYDEPDDFKYLIIKVQNRTIEDRQEQGHDVYSARYEATRWCWRVNVNNVKDYPYVFSVTDGVVREVYKVDKWQKVVGGNRYEFFGSVAEQKIRQRFVDKRIPDTYSVKGMASPVLYSKNIIS